MIEPFKRAWIYFAEICGDVTSAFDKVVEQQQLALAVGGFAPQAGNEVWYFCRGVLPGYTAYPYRSKIYVCAAKHFDKFKVLQNGKLAALAAASIFVIPRNRDQRNFLLFQARDGS